MSSAAEEVSYWGPGGGHERCVGYALSSKKAESFITASLLNHAKQRGIRLVPIDRQKPLSSQGPFHCIIHKLSDADWNRQLTEYSSDHLAVPIIDPRHAVQRLQDRVSMLQVVPRLQIPPSSPSFGIPNQICKTAGDLDDLDLGLLKFPVIAKPLVANGTAKSHQMCLVLRREGLEELEMEAPFVLQEFVNHGGVVFKVYVVGDHVTCVKRRSLPDIIPPSGEGSNSNSNSNLLSFSQISNASTATDDDDGGGGAGASEMPPLSFLTDFAKALRDALELHLFNFDVIRDSSNHSHYYIIDINYFPGYAKMPSYESVFTDFFLGMLPPHHSSTSPSPSN